MADEAITEEDLAYLNDNLDLVEEYCNNDTVLFSYERYGKLFDIHRQNLPSTGANYVWLRTTSNCSFLRDWKHLLAYVQEHYDSPPILK